MTGTIRTSRHAQIQARKYWAQQLPLSCPFCGLPVTHDTPWHLDHALPVIYGGGDDQVRPAHARCNERGGAAITNARRRFFREAARRSRPAGEIFDAAESRDREW